MMKFFTIFGLLTGASLVFGQQEYFTKRNKVLGLDYYQNKIYGICPEPKLKQDPVSVDEMTKLIQKSKKVVSETFSQAFKENPKVEAAYLKDLENLKEQTGCQLPGNNCRAKLLALSLYYYQQLRADIPGCQNYKKPGPTTVETDIRCELEDKYRKSSFEGVSNNYGKLGPGSYKNELIAQKNNTTEELTSLILHKDETNLHICKPSKRMLSFRNSLDLKEAGKYFEGLDPSKDSGQSLVDRCKDEKKTLHHEFVPLNFDEGRSTVGRDQAEPVKVKIWEFIKSHPEMIVTDITVTSSTSRAPFYMTVAKRKVIDPKSDQKGLSLANERMAFINKVLTEIKSSNSEYSKITLKVAAELAGPKFNPLDLNDRWVTKMTPGFEEKLSSHFTANEKAYKEKALKNSHYDLMNETEFVNLYQAKYKPFHGFRIHIQGLNKNEMKCKILESDPESGQSSTSRQ